MAEWHMFTCSCICLGLKENLHQKGHKKNKCKTKSIYGINEKKGHRSTV